MSITRKFLKGIGIEDEKVDAIIEAHTEVTNRMQAEIDGLKAFEADAKKLPVIQKELDDAKAEVAKNADLQKKFDDEHAAFEGYKKDIETKDARNKVKDAYKALLKANKIDDKRFDSILKVTDLATLQLNDDGKFDNERELNSAIKTEWKDFIVTTEDRGGGVENPPANSGGKSMTKEDIMAIKDANERQQAIAENPELFGI